MLQNEVTFSEWHPPQETLRDLEPFVVPAKVGDTEQRLAYTGLLMQAIGEAAIKQQGPGGSYRKVNLLKGTEFYDIDLSGYNCTGETYTTSRVAEGLGLDTVISFYVTGGGPHFESRILIGSDVWCTSSYFKRPLNTISREPSQLISFLEAVEGSCGFYVYNHKGSDEILCRYFTEDEIRDRSPVGEAGVNKARAYLVGSSGYKVLVATDVLATLRERSHLSRKNHNDYLCAKPKLRNLVPKIK